MKKLLLITLLGAFLFAGAAQAQVNDLPRPGMLPDHPLYFLKSWGEGIGTFLTFGDIPKAERYLALAERRLAEANALADKGKPEIAERALERYRERLNRALGKAEEAKQKGLDTDEVLAKVSEATLKHQAVLLEVYEKVPEQARPAIERAMEQSMRGHEEALQAISGEKREQIREEVETRKQEVFQKVEQLRERGIPVPEILPMPIPPVEPPVELPIELPLPIMGQFPGKVVYTTDISVDPTLFQSDCDQRGGVFDSCGTICPPEAEVCATVCAYTCEF